MSRLPVLVTLLPSTDSDMGRWLLKHYGVAYREEPHAPVFHLRVLKKMGLERTDLPVLRDDQGLTVNVDGIVARFDPLAGPERQLVPDAVTAPDHHADVMDLHKRLRWDMGMGTVRWAYFHFLQHRDLVWPSLSTGIPATERLLLRVGYPAVKGMMFKALGLSEETSREALADVRSGFDEVEARLADGRPFLCGDRLSLADLAFATAAAPMVLARGYGGHLAAFDTLPREMQEVIAALRARPAGQFIQRLYDEFRAD